MSDRTEQIKELYKELEQLENEISRIDGIKFELMSKASLIADKLADLGEEFI